MPVTRYLLRDPDGRLVGIFASWTQLDPGDGLVFNGKNYQVVRKSGHLPEARGNWAAELTFARTLAAG